MYVQIQKLKDGNIGGIYRDGRRIKIKKSSKKTPRPGEEWICKPIKEGKRVIYVEPINEVDIANPPAELDPSYNIDIHRDTLKATYYHTDFVDGKAVVKRKFDAVMFFPPKPKKRVSMFYLGAVHGTLFHRELVDPKEIKKCLTEHGREDLWDVYVDLAARFLLNLKLRGFEVNEKDYGDEVAQRLNFYLSELKQAEVENEEDLEI